MANKFFQLTRYFSYWLDAVDEHSLHSPFLFDFYTRIVKSRKAQTGILQIEILRKKLLRNRRVISALNYGSGKRYNTSIASIARTSISPARYSALYWRIIEATQAKHILELGTSFGINTLYLAQPADARVTTFEGSPEIADVARLTFQFYKSHNISLVEGNLSDTLSRNLRDIRKIDFVLMDANHLFQPTIDYFELLMPKIQSNSIIVVDDIHSSHEMEMAWKTLKAHRLVYGSADLFRCGILFFDPSLNKQHVILQY